ncbi:uncharacterized protein [Argopecten irradians]|uniref:uncharacterized protein isoform X2 n=1 Tax=Argopecten irradians TaxID=31199 RepID=UPI00371C216C
MAVTEVANIFIAWCAIFVGYCSGEVYRNFTCITYNWDETLTCSWSVAREFSGSSYTTAVDWQITGFPRMLCPSLTPSTCVWSLGGDGQQGDTDPYQPIRVGLYLLRQNRTIHTQYYKVDLEQKVKPAAVSNLRAKPLRLNCIFVEWTHYKVDQTKIYSLEVSSPGLNTIRKIHGMTNFDSTEFDQEVSNTTICNLFYYTNYTVTVRVRAIDMDYQQIGYWSDPLHTRVLTSKSVPSSPPFLPPGGYTLSAINNEGYRMARVHWQEVPKNTRSGETITYDVEAVPLGNCGSRTVRSSVQKSPADFDIKSGCHYSVAVWTRNERGRSNDASVLHIKQNAIPKPRDVFLVKGGTPGLANITWLEPKGANSSWTYTVYWCNKLPGYYCKGQFNTMTGISPKYDSELVTAEIKMDAHPNATYMFGVSSERNQNGAIDSSGFVWTDCSMLSTDYLKYPRISFHGLPSENKARLTWTYVDCAETMIKKSHLQQYLIRGCILNSCTDLTADGKQSYVDFPVTEADHQICVTIAVRLDKVSGEPSRSHCYTLPPPGSFDHLNGVALTLIILSGLAILVILITILIFGIRWWRKPTRLQIPQIPKEDNERPLVNDGSSLSASAARSCTSTETALLPNDRTC